MRKNDSKFTDSFKISKVIRLVLMAIFALFNAGYVHAGTNKDFVHATYLAADRIESRKQLKDMRIDQFNFIYLFKGGPAWKPEYFDLPDAEVMDKLVNKHSYPEGDSGMALVPELIKLAHSKNVKVLVSIPARKTFNPIAADDKKRVLFARVMATFCKKYDFDGIELDWEGNISQGNHIKLMGDFRKALDKYQSGSKKYFLTTALHYYRRYSKKDADIMSGYVDWINIMTYDMGGGRWGKVPSHNTPLNIMKERLAKRWSVFPHDKLCIGLANYGFYYKGIMPGEKCGNLRKEKGARYITYKELPPLLEKGWTESYDEKAQAPYYFSPDKKEFVTMDNNRSQSRKIEWVLDNNFKGVFWWEFQYDYYPPAPGKDKATHPLIDHVSDLIDKAGRKLNTK